MKGYPLIKLLSRLLDRSYLWWTLEKSRTDHRPSHYEFSRFTVEDYLDSPELFYPRPKGVTGIRFMETKRTSGIEVSWIMFPSPVQTRYRENNVPYGELFRPTGKTPAASMIVLHGWSRPGLNLEERFCLSFGRRGIASLLMTLPYHMQRAPAGSWSGEYALSADVLRTIDGFRQSVLEVRTIIPLLKRYSEKIGILGISLGGMIAHVVMDLEDLDYGITLLAGGDNAGIVWEGIDPARLARHNRVERMLMINGLYDQVVPPKFTLQLWECLGRPPIRWYPCAHVSFFLFLKRILHDVVHFIEGSETPLSPGGF